MNYKIKLFFVNCILLSCLSLIIIKAIPNYFYNSKQETISFFDQDEYEREWLRIQQPLIRHDYNVFNNNEIIEILKMHDNGSYYFSSYFDSNKPGYNNNNEKNLGCYWFKNPPYGLITVYFKYRENPFNKKYPIGDYKYTFDDLLKYEICIEEAHVFWNANQKEIDPNLKIHHEIFTIHPDQNNDDYKKELIQNYLHNSGITKDKRFVKLNRYNYNSTTGIVIPFKPSIYKDDTIKTIEANIIDLENKKSENIKEMNTRAKLYDYAMNNHMRSLLAIDTNLEEQINILKDQAKRTLPIEAVYFDNGIRFNESNLEINDLLKLSNGAKNVYLFSFKIKETKNVILDPSDNPYESIQKWKKDNQYSFTIINESPFVWEIDGDNANLNQIVETKFIIYDINCPSNYKDKLDRWKNQCYFKPYDVKDAAQVREKISDGATLYTNDDSSIYAYLYDQNIYPNNDGSIDTEYQRGGIYFDGKNVRSFIPRWRDVKFNGYFDTSRPPNKNELIQDLTQINREIKIRKLRESSNKLNEIHKETIIRNNK